MTARTFLVRGLLAGLVAGLLTFAVAYVVGEPQVETAIGLEESAGTAAPTSTHTHDGAGAAAHSHDDGEAVVSRGTQRTWGLLTGSLAVGVALGGLLGLASAAAVGRLGRLSPRQSTGVVAAVGFVGFALVPFLKYPANPPAVGSADTIGARTEWYFVFVLVSLLAAVAATVLANLVASRRGAYAGLLAGGAAYLLVVVVVGTLMPTVDEVGDFPADTLWFFRRASLVTLTTMWAVIGIVLAGLIGREHHQLVVRQERRDLAASL